MKILLLGNGFDLYHYFPTRYDNFLHTVDFLQKHYDEKTMSTIGDVFGDERLLKTDSFIPKCYEKYSSVYNDFKLDVDKINQIISLSKDNIWFKYFLSVFNKELGWIDFEREIARVIHAFEMFFLKETAVSDISFPTDKIDEYIIKFFDFFYENKVLDPSDSSWLSVYRVNAVLKEYQIEKLYGSKIVTINKFKIIEKLYDKLLNLSEILKLYLEVFVNDAIDMISEQHLLPKTSLFNGVDTVITFNYTTTFENIYEANNVHHLHGELTDNIILGVNPDANDEANEEDFVNTDFLKFKKYYQRVLNGSDIGYLESIKLISEAKTFIDHYGEELYVAGHSLDVTDEDIIREVFSLSDEITIVCYNQKAIADSINNLIKIYGKSEFDSIRADTNMKFKLYSDFEQ